MLSYCVKTPNNSACSSQIFSRFCFPRVFYVIMYWHVILFFSSLGSSEWYYPMYYVCNTSKLPSCTLHCTLCVWTFQDHSLDYPDLPTPTTTPTPGRKNRRRSNLFTVSQHATTTVTMREHQPVLPSVFHAPNMFLPLLLTLDILCYSCTLYMVWPATWVRDWEITSHNIHWYISLHIIYTDIQQYYKHSVIVTVSLGIDP